MHRTNSPFTVQRREAASGTARFEAAVSCLIAGCRDCYQEGNRGVQDHRSVRAATSDCSVGAVIAAVVIAMSEAAKPLVGGASPGRNLAALNATEEGVRAIVQQQN
jgi:hypothetical protein